MLRFDVKNLFSNRKCRNENLIVPKGPSRFFKPFRLPFKNSVSVNDRFLRGRLSFSDSLFRGQEVLTRKDHRDHVR